MIVLPRFTESNIQKAWKKAFDNFAKAHKDYEELSWLFPLQKYDLYLTMNELATILMTINDLRDPE